MPFTVCTARKMPPTGSGAAGWRSHSSNSWLHALRCSRLSARNSSAYWDRSTAYPRTRWTASRTREGWKGLTTKSLAPAWIASTTSACCPMALHIRILASGSNLVISRTASMPPMSGITMSIVTRSGLSCLYLSTACTPVSASPTTSKPAWARMSLIIVRMKMASSQTRTVWLTHPPYEGSTGVNSASVSRTTKRLPARRPTARTRVGSMPGSACRRSSAPPSTVRRSTTSSTVKPRTLRPSPTSSSTVVPPSEPWGGSGWPSARHPSTTVTRVPRTFTRPATTGGAPGIRVGSSRGRISRTVSASAAQVRRPTRNRSSRTTPASLIRCEEAKILQQVALSKQTRIRGRFRERRREIGGPFGSQREPRTGYGMVEGERRRVQQLPRSERLEALGGAALGGGDAPAAPERVLAIAHDGMAHVREMHADLMRAPRAEPHPQQIDLREPRDDGRVRHGVPPSGEHGHALAVLGMAGDRRLDRDRALREVAPGERGVEALDAPLLDHGGEAAVRRLRLRDEEQARRVAVEPVHDAGPALRPGRERRAPPREHVHQRVVPVSRARVDHKACRLVEHGEVLVLEHEGQRVVSGGIAPGGRRVGRERDRDDRAALQPCGGAQWPTARADALVGDEAGRDRARQGELIGEKAVEALGLGGDDAERDGGRRHGCSTALASLARSCARPSSQRETASAIAPTVMAESATLNVGQRADPMPTSTKSTTPCALRMRSTTLPTAPAHTRASETMRNRSPDRVASTIERSTTRATRASPKKIQRE